MSEKVKISLSIITDGSDIIPAESIVRSGAELRRMWFNALRRKFLQENGEEFFVREGAAAEENKKAQWTKESNMKFPDQGDYTIPLDPGTAIASYNIEHAVFLGKI